LNRKSIRFDPENFLTLAELLIDAKESQSLEASYRTIINRSYLAVVWKAALLLEPLVGVPIPQSAEFYRFVEDALAKRNALNSKNKLGALRRWRNDADYKLDVRVRKGRAEYAISTAKDVLTLIESEIV